jgi:hypothetical protein
MAFGFDNPFEDPFNQRQNPFATPARQPAANAIPPLAPHEEEGILSKLGTSALGGLGYIGGSLDKAFGGRAIRGLLGGKLEELASIIPFSDKLGITNEENAVSGKELLGYDKNDDSWGGFLGGLGAELLTDPATYLTFGGKTAIGQAAAKAGALPKVTQPITRQAGSGLKNLIGKFNPLKAADMEGSLAAQMRGVDAASPEAAKIAAKAGVTAADVADKPLAALATLKLPFIDEPFAALGTGKTAQNVANKLASIKDAATYSNVGRAVTPLFDNRLSKFGPSPTTEIGQRAVRGAADEFAAKTPELVGKFLENRAVGEGLGMMDPARAPAANRELTGLLEGTIKQSALPEFNTPEVQKMIADLRGEYKSARPAAAKTGRAAAQWDSKHGVDYSFRQLTDAGEDWAVKEGGASRRALNPYNQSDLARNELFDLPGGTNAVNDLFVDPLAQASGVLGGQTLNRSSRNVRQKYLGWNRQQEQSFLQMAKDVKTGVLPEKILDPTTQEMVINPAFEQYAKLRNEKLQSRKLSKMATKAGGQEIPFADNPLGLMSNYRQADEFSNTAAKTFKDIVAARAGMGGPDSVDVLTALKDSKYNNPNMKEALVAALQAKGILGPKDKWAKLAQVTLPADVAADITRYGQSFAKPRELNPILDAFDSATNLTKMSQTTMLPFTIPTLLRNALTEGYTNVLSGAKAPGSGVMGHVAPWLQAMGLRRGEDVAALGKTGTLAGMTPGDATKKASELMFQYGVTKPADKIEAAGIVGRGSRTSDVGPGVLAPLGGKQKSAIESLKGSVPQSWEEATPWDVRGFNGRTETNFAPARGAQELMHNVDDTGRSAAFLAALQQGYEPAAAAELANKLRMNPDALTGFEKDWMRRLIPYYSWQRAAIPGMLGELAQKPGGVVGRSIRATNELRQKDGLIPDFVGEGLALPLGERQPDGTQRYLSGLGLPFEELNRIANQGPTPIASTLQRMMGNLNPLLKLPIESATGMQLYSGRHLDDLYPRYGSSAIDQLVGASPLATVGRAGSRLLDDRKGVSGNLMGLLSPARLTDADMNRAAQTQGRRLLEEQLRTNPAVRSMERLYVPPEMQGAMSPEELQMLRLYSTLMQRQQAANAARQ